MTEPLRTMRQIAEEVAEKHGMTYADLKNPERNAVRSRVRQEAWAIMDEEGRWSRTQMAMALGRKNPTTVLHGIRRHHKRVNTKAPARKKGRPSNAPRISTRERLALERAYDYAERLRYRYGPERAASIMAGTDPAANADIAKWNALGRAHERRAGL